MTQHTIQMPIDLRALDECICGHRREVHEDRSKDCDSCGCSLFSKTAYRYSKLTGYSESRNDAE
jgi:hypothetical protein